MPIYEYQAIDPGRACPHCREPFEAFQDVRDEPFTICPQCGQGIRKVISWCRAAVTERSTEDLRVKREIKSYENSGMWSHAAELADKHSEKTRDKKLKARALDNYQKAGYDADKLAKHAKIDDQ